MVKILLSSISFIAISSFLVHGYESPAVQLQEEGIILMQPKPLPPRNRAKKNIWGWNNRNAPISCGSCCYNVVSADGYDLDPFYAKVVEVDGFVIASSAAVSDDALYEAALTVAKMTKRRPDLLQNLIEETVHLAVIGKNEVLTDIPEYSVLGSGWDWARGVGATRWIPVTSCAEENLLCLNNDVYFGENICIHETAHSLQGSGGKLPIPRTVEYNNFSEYLDPALRNLYTEAVINNGLWAGDYSATNHEEYWAEGVQSFYNANIGSSANTKSELQSYDNGLYSIISRVFPADVTITCPTENQCDCSSFQCPGATPCEDSGIRFKYKKKRKTCRWLAQSQKKDILCGRNGLQKMCPVTCGKCNKYACIDVPKKFYVNGRQKTCQWVRNKNTQKRCQKEGVKTTCRSTCGFCD